MKFTDLIDGRENNLNLIRLVIDSSVAASVLDCLGKNGIEK